MKIFALVLMLVSGHEFTHEELRPQAHKPVVHTSVKENYNV